jgi:hypothetical protein
MDAKAKRKVIAEMLARLQADMQGWGSEATPCGSQNQQIGRLYQYTPLANLLCSGVACTPVVAGDQDRRRLGEQPDEE